ncbi:MAG: hypothetical protein EOP05_15420 [Proteobacteria bacterium]|nr:MAG: hypothetical protein EOP05_15420 [Pseudomonadota bacterium]
MNRFITRNERVTAFNVQVEGYPQPIAVTAPAAMNADTQMMATIFAAAYMTSDTEKSMLAKLRVCDINDNRCDKSQVGKVAEFESSELGNRFRAAQTFEGDSIAFDLITAAAKADKERNEWLAVYNNREKALGDAILKFTASDLRIRMDATLSKLPELAPVRELMVGTGNSLWAQTEALTTNVKRQKYYTFAKELQKVIIAANAAFAKLGESDKPSKAATNECDKDDSPCMNKATDVADTRTAIINEAKAQAGEFAQLLNEMITVDRNYVLSPLMTKSAIAEVKGHENNIETLQKFVFQIEKLQ